MINPFKATELYYSKIITVIIACRVARNSERQNSVKTLTIQIKAIFRGISFILLYKVVPTFRSILEM